MKILVMLLLSAISAFAQTNSVHVWHQNGKEVAGNYVASGQTSLVIKVHGTNYFIGLGTLSDADRQYLATIKKAEKQRRLDMEAAQMSADGKIEFTIKQIDNFPERLVNRHGWIDCNFREITSVDVDSKEDTLGLEIRDKNGDTSMEFMALKMNPYTGEQEPIIAQIEQLKTGDSIRLFVMGMPDIKHDDMTKLSGVYISSLEMIETAAEKEASEEAELAPVAGPKK